MREYLESVLGNADSRTRLGRAIESGTLPHALLISGAAGSGKHTIALSVAAALNCESKSNNTRPLPCGVCNSCRRIKEGSFTDIKTLSRKKDKVTIGVGEVRDFREDMFLSATESSYKVYIIESAEALTVEAQNALLTVLEEPPTGVVIILLATECDRLLTTIKSRVQLITTERFSEAELEGYLIKKSRDAAEIRAKKPETFRSLIMSAGGILGEAIRLSDPKRAEENARDRDEVLAIVNTLSAGTQYSKLYKAFSQLPTKRQELSAVLEGVLSALADIIKVKTSAEPHLTFYPSVESARAAASDMTVLRATKIYDAILLALGNLSQNAGVAGTVSSLILTVHTV